MYQIVLEKAQEIEDYCEEHIADYLEALDPESVEDIDYSDAHHELFNTQYYVIGTYDATQWLGTLAFDAIAFITDYEQDNFGEVFTDLSRPEAVVNMVAYIIGEQVLPTVIDSHMSELGLE